MQGGGAERVAALLCNHWTAGGHQVMLVPTFSGRGQCWYSLNESVDLVYLADRVNAVRKNAITQAIRLLTMRRIIREFRPDVVVSFLSYVNIATILATCGLGIAVVVSERNYPPATPIGPLWDKLRKFTYPMAKAVVMQTEQGRDWLNRYSPKSNARVIANPLVYPLPKTDPILNPERVVDKTKYIILAVGRLEWQKGFDLLLKAFSKIVNQFTGWDLVILGEGSQRKNLERQGKRLDISESLHLPGKVGNLEDWYKRGDLYVLSSRFEGFPNALLEAMGHALPPISFDCKTGPKDIIRHNKDGILVSLDKGSEGLARALNALINKPDIRNRMSTASIDVRERFAISKIAQQWNNLLNL